MFDIDGAKQCNHSVKNGVVLKKTDKTGSKSLKAGKVMFKLTSAKAKDYKGTKKL